MILQGINVEDLLSRIEKIVEKHVSEKIESLTINKPNKLISRKEVASFLKISLPTLNTWTKLGLLKSYRIGNRILYREQEIESSLHYRKFKHG